MTGVVQVNQVLKPEAIRVGLPGRHKEEVIDALVDLLAAQPAVKDPALLREAVLERERVMSTGVGKGLALPHAKTAAVTETVAAFAITAEPVAFGSIDNQPVRLVFLLAGPETAKSQHIKLLSRISRLMNRDAFRTRLLQARNAQEALHIFEEGEAQLLDL